MRRIAAVIVLLAGAIFVAPPSATAVPLQRIVSKTGLPQAIDPLQLDCPVGLLAHITLTSAYSHVFGPGFPPSGTGTLDFRPAANELPGLGIAIPGNLDDLTTLSVSVKNPDATTLTTVIFVEAGGAGDVWELQGTATKSTPGYATYSVPDLTYTWRSETTLTSGGPGTIADFLAAHAQTTAGFHVALMSGDCNHISTHQVYFDHIDRVEAGVGKRYDFESPTGGLTIAASHAIITKGDAVRLSTKLTDGGLPRAGATVTLWAKKRGAARFQLVRTVAATNSNGAASATLRPKTATTYQWRHAKDAHTQATRSPTTLVQIAA